MLENLIKNLAWFSHLFHDDESAERTLTFIGLKVKNSEYLSFIFSISLFLSVIASVITYFIGQSPLLSIVLFAFIFFSLKYLPNYLQSRRIEQMEAELPFFIKTFKISIEVGKNFEKSLEDVINLSPGEFSKEVAKNTQNMRLRGNVIDALSKMCEIDSNAINRAVNQMIFIYREGSGLETLEEIAKEVLVEKNMKIREFNSKFAIYGLLFIATALLLPAFFTSYIVIGSSFLDVALSSESIFLYYLLVFPSFLAIILLLVKFKSPPSIAEKAESFSTKEMEDLFASFIGKRGLKINFVIYETLIISLWFLLNFEFLFIFLVLFGLPIFLLFFYNYKRSKEIEKREEELIPLLFNIAAKSDNIVEAIKAASVGKNELSDDFKQINNMIKAGYSVKESLSSLSEKSDSFLLKRALLLMEYGSEVGESISQPLKDTAEEIYNLFLILKERRAAMSMQKYTILLGAILTPIILSMIFSLSKSLPTTDFSVSETVRNSMVAASYLGVQIYFFVYALLASIFISMEEGRNGALIYFLFITSVSFSLFLLL